MLVSGMLLSFGCSDSDDPQDPIVVPPDKVEPDPAAFDPKSVSIAISVDVDGDTAVLTLTPSDEEADYFAGVVLSSEVEGLEDDAVIARMVASSDFQSGIRSGKQTVSFTELEAECSYTAVAFCYVEEEAGYLYAEPFTVASGYDDLLESAYCDLDFYGDYHLTGTLNYMMRLGVVDHNGIHMLEYGVMHNLSIYCSEFSDPATKMPAMGTYTFDTERTAGNMKMDSRESTATEMSDPIYDYEDAHVSYTYYTDGDLTISDLGGGNYRVVANLLFKERRLRIVYSGPITAFDDREVGVYRGPVLDHDVEFVADYPYTPNYVGSELSFRLNDGGDIYDDSKTNEDRPNRIWVALAGVSTCELPLGTFVVGDDKEGEITVRRGEYHHAGEGYHMLVGTYWSTMSNNYIQTNGFIDSGSVTISVGEAGVYEIEGDFVTVEGYKVKFSYVDTDDQLKDKIASVAAYSAGTGAPEAACLSRVMGM